MLWLQGLGGLVWSEYVSDLWNERTFTSIFRHRLLLYLLVPFLYLHQLVHIHIQALSQFILLISIPSFRLDFHYLILNFNHFIGFLLESIFHPHNFLIAVLNQIRKVNLRLMHINFILQRILRANRYCLSKDRLATL